MEIFLKVVLVKFALNKSALTKELLYLASDETKPMYRKISKLLDS